MKSTEIDLLHALFVMLFSWQKYIYTQTHRPLYHACTLGQKTMWSLHCHEARHPRQNKVSVIDMLYLNMCLYLKQLLVEGHSFPG